ncbi:ATP-binding protein [Dyella sp. SG609]|uniref:ATP-binding protein n=2 Tax=unclassified Dyella TaxID=2634549 RepID=UPI0014469179|nr:ATP-binding protein [Dyella sp. SG609]NKJ19937.1 two-component system sensor histidine kinase QseC [Dyella sp. SG609]
MSGSALRFPSLRARLRWMVIAILAAAMLLLGALSYRYTLKEVHELLDGRLAQSARTLDVLLRTGGMPPDGRPVVVPTPSRTPAAHGKGTHSYEPEVGYQVFAADGRVLATTANLDGMPAPRADDKAFRDVSFGTRRWRVFQLPRGSDGEWIRTAERYDSRTEISQALWVQYGLMLFVALPLLALLMGWAIRRGLKPLDTLARRLLRREPGSHAPVTLENAPTELRPLLDALNEQIGRLENALERERRFSADVAHELRTPLASTMINLDAAIGAREPGAADSALADARECLVALARRTEQLLALARLESGEGRRAMAPVDLATLAGDVIDEMVSVIAHSQVELVLAPLPPRLVVHGDEAALRAMLRNLLENAMRHVPSGGMVELALSRAGRVAVIDVVDNGPGIPPERRAALFERFHREPGTRGDGYGLGLSIVQRAAQMHGADIQLLDSRFGTGLHVRVSLLLHGDEAARER